MVFIMNIAGDVWGNRRNILVEFSSRPPLHTIITAAETLFTPLLCVPAPSASSSRAFLVSSVVYFDHLEMRWIEVYSASQLPTGVQVYCFGSPHVGAGEQPDAIPNAELSVIWEDVYTAASAAVPTAPAEATVSKRKDECMSGGGGGRTAMRGVAASQLKRVGSSATAAVAVVASSPSFREVEELSRHMRVVFSALDIEQRGYLLLRDFDTFTYRYALSPQSRNNCSQSPSRLASANSSHATAAAAAAERLLEQCGMSFEDIVRAADKDCDGCISFKEWVEFSVEHPHVVHVLAIHYEQLQQQRGAREGASGTDGREKGGGSSCGARLGSSSSAPGGVVLPKDTTACGDLSATRDAAASRLCIGSGGMRRRFCRFRHCEACATLQERENWSESRIASRNVKPAPRAFVM